MKKNQLLILLFASIMLISNTINAQIIEENSEVQPEYNQEMNTLFVKPEKTQDDIKTIFGPVNSHGFYIGIESMFIDYNEWLSSGINVKMDWVLNHVFSMGIQGGFLESPREFNTYLQSNASIESGFGGINFEFTPAPKWPVHLSIPLNLGFGSMYLMGTDETAGRYWDDHDYFTVLASDFFVYVQPAIQLEFNMLKHLRLGFGVSYFQTNAIAIDGISKYALNGPSGIFSLKIGKF